MVSSVRLAHYSTGILSLVVFLEVPVPVLKEMEDAKSVPVSVPVPICTYRRLP